MSYISYQSAETLILQEPGSYHRRGEDDLWHQEENKAMCIVLKM